MIKACFYKKETGYSGFLVGGHALFSEHGRDIVCAAVSSAVQLSANGVTEVAGAKAKVAADEKSANVELLLLEENEGAKLFIAALALHLKDLSTRYPGTIKISEVEG